jgi:hypothetical protein
MKSGMKKLVSISSLSAFVLATILLLLLGTAEATGPAMDPVSGTGSTQLVLAPPPEGVMMQFEGSVVLFVRGELKTADLLVNVYSVVENEEGVQHVSASHIFTFGDGSTITTVDTEVAEPTDTPGLYTLNGNLDAASGTGVYDGASGHLTAHGTMDFRGLPTASFTVRGAVSSPATELFLLGTAEAKGPARDPVSGTGLSQLDVINPPPEGVMMQFEGSVVLFVRGESKTAHLLVNVYSVAENEEGVQHVSASHMFTFEDGSTITTVDTEVAEPTDTPGLYTLNGNLDVASGTGVYEGASGHLTAHGTMDFRGPPTASFTVRGAVSSPATE